MDVTLFGRNNGKLEVLQLAWISKFHRSYLVASPYDASKPASWNSHVAGSVWWGWNGIGLGNVVAAIFDSGLDGPI